MIYNRGRCYDFMACRFTRSGRYRCFRILALRITHLPFTSDTCRLIPALHVFLHVYAITAAIAAVIVFISSIRLSWSLARKKDMSGQTCKFRPPAWRAST